MACARSSTGKARASRSLATSGAGKSSSDPGGGARAKGLRVLRGQCDPLRTPRPLGPFRSWDCRTLDALVRAEETRLSGTAEAGLTVLGSEPTVLVIEDLHWANAASADVLRYLERRVETVPLAMLLSYRDLEIGPRHQARQLLGDFAALEGLRTLALQPLPSARWTPRPSTGLASTRSSCTS